MTRARFLIATALALVVGVGTGCGSSDKDASPAAAGETSTTKTPVGVKAAGLIAFRRYFDSTESTGGVFTIKPDGTGERELVHPPAEMLDDQPAISPDGSKIAFTRCPIDENKPCRAYVAGRDGRDVTELPVQCSLKPVCDSNAPAWSESGQLALGRASGTVKVFDDGGNQIERSEVVIYDPKRGTVKSVARMDHWQGDVGDPVWSPDGKRVAYSLAYSVLSKRQGRALFVVSAKGGKPRRVTPWKLAAGDHPDWSPDGRWLVFRTHADLDEGPSQLSIIHPDGTGLKRFHLPGYTVLSASFSPDGKWIAYGAPNEKGVGDVYVVRSDGTGSRPLTRNALWDSAPDWGP